MFLDIKELKLSKYKKTAPFFSIPEGQLYQNQSVCLHFLRYSFVETIFKMELKHTCYKIYRHVYFTFQLCT